MGNTSTEADRAAELFGQGFNCAQSVLEACGERYGLEPETALRVAEAFGGGMGRMGLTCGAVTGAMMAIGLKHAKLTPDDNASRRKSIELARRLREAFEARHGTIACRELLGCDISTAEGFLHAKDAGLFRDICTKAVRDAAEIVADLLAHSEDQL